jgi:hypothetical protein
MKRAVYVVLTQMISWIDVIEQNAALSVLNAAASG